MSLPGSQALNLSATAVERPIGRFVLTTFALKFVSFNNRNQQLHIAEFFAQKKNWRTQLRTYYIRVGGCGWSTTLRSNLL